jgi:hypothetical protein
MSMREVLRENILRVSKKRSAREGPIKSMTNTLYLPISVNSYLRLRSSKR